MFIKKFKRVCLMALLLLMAVSVWGCSMETDGRPATNQNSSNGELLEVYFIDVGQADSILIKTHDGKVMLIDAGNNADSSFITGYLKQQKISRIDILVGTHPHEDHIGGLDAVIQNFDIGEFYMPKKLKTSQTFDGNYGEGDAGVTVVTLRK
jgi:competence protein ComEC